MYMFLLKCCYLEATLAVDICCVAAPASSGQMLRMFVLYYLNRYLNSRGHMVLYVAMYAIVLKIEMLVSGTKILLIVR